MDTFTIVVFLMRQRIVLLCFDQNTPKVCLHLARTFVRSKFGERAILILQQHSVCVTPNHEILLKAFDEFHEPLPVIPHRPIRNGS